MQPLSDLIKDEAGAAIDALGANPTLATAGNAIEGFGTAVAIGAARAANPLAGAAAAVFVPMVMHEVATALVQLFRHVGAAVPAQLNDAVEKLEAAIHIDLDGDGIIGDDGHPG